MLLTGIVFKQLHYMQNKDMGLDKENIVCIYTSLWYNVGDFKQELLRNPDIKGVSMSSPIESFGEGTNYKARTAARWSGPMWTDAPTLCAWCSCGPTATS